MPDLFPFVVILFVAGLVLYFYLRQRNIDSERARRVQSFAAAKGWSYVEKDPAIRKELGFPFGWGSQTLNNFIRGTTDGAAFLMFDFIVTTKNSRIERTIAAFRLPDQAPRFRVVPNDWSHLLDRSLTWERLAFPQDPGFSAAYRVESPDAQRAGVIFDDAVRGGLTHSPGRAIDSRNGWLQLASLDFPAPEDLDSFLSLSYAVARPFLNK